MAKTQSVSAYAPKPKKGQSKAKKKPNKHEKSNKKPYKGQGR